MMQNGFLGEVTPKPEPEVALPLAQKPVDLLDGPLALGLFDQSNGLEVFYAGYKRQPFILQNRRNPEPIIFRSFPPGLRVHKAGVYSEVTGTLIGALMLDSPKVLGPDDSLTFQPGSICV